jgi:hypothetical protein
MPEVHFQGMLTGVVLGAVPHPPPPPTPPPPPNPPPPNLYQGPQMVANLCAKSTTPLRGGGAFFFYSKAKIPALVPMLIDVT